jgi:serine/threonine-protein kinase
VSDTIARGATAMPESGAPRGAPSGSLPALTGPPISSDPYLGTTVAGRYKILNKLGEGGMGVVYLAEHVFIEKKVAIKILSEDFARKADLVTRFMQEAKAASKIGHENIIDITDFGETASGSVFFVMEYLDGSDLARHIRETGALELNRAVFIMNQICRALGAAHGKGIIHRDLKPENIYLVEREGRADFVKILDFGIAKMSSLDNEGGARLTRTGMIFGTPEYMSPEQARGDRPDHRVDIYAAGCILYEMLTGDVPFHAETFMGVLTKHMFDAPVPPSQRAPHLYIPPAVEAVVLKALAKDRDQRFQSMKEMAIALAEAMGADVSQAWAGEASGVNIRMPETSSQPIRLPTGAQPAAAAAVPATAPPATTPPASSTMPPARSRAGLFAGLGAAVALAGVGTVAYLKMRPGPSPSQPPVIAASPTPTTAPTAMPTTAPTTTPAPAPTAVEPTPKPAAAPAKSTITIGSNPADAEIFNGPERLGVTPAKLELDATTAAFDVVLKKKGYKEAKLRVQPDRNREYVLDLQKASSSSSGTKVSLPKPPPTPPPTTASKPPAPESKPAGKLRDLKDPFAN